MSFDSESESTIKILRLQWLPIHDVFSYKVEVLTRTCSKRIILNELARIFDPLGFVAPLTFLAKHLIQRLWCMGLDWDEAPPHDIITVWDQYKAQLPQLSSLQILRRIFAGQMISCELHGFCDAREHGYAAVLYIRITEPNGTIKSFLVCAKSKVAPLKRISIPKLELCGAQLLAKLIRRLVNIYSRYISFDKVWAWTDSSIALAWIRSPSSNWKTFVSNRVSDIQNNLPDAIWRHISSEDNPADCASRDLLPSEFVNHHILWFNGSAFLCTPSTEWPEDKFNPSDPDTASEEERRSIVLTTSIANLTFTRLLMPGFLKIFIGGITLCVNNLQGTSNVIGVAKDLT